MLYVKYPQQTDNVTNEESALNWIDRIINPTPRKVEIMNINQPQKEEVVFNEQQQEAFDLIVNGIGNVLVTGNAGTGKSFVINHAVEALRLKGNNVTVCSTTAVSATAINGKTVHSAFRIIPMHKTKSKQWTLKELLDQTVFSLAGDGMKTKSLRQEIRCTDVIVMDEVSMLNVVDLIRLEHQLKTYGPKKGELYGGIRMIFVGDFLQLEPVVSDSSPIQIPAGKSAYAFDSDRAWKNALIHTVQLTKIVRQKDLLFGTFLNNIRLGIWHEWMSKIVEECKTREMDDSNVPRFYARNDKVNQINDEKLSALPGKEYVYKAHDINPDKWDSNIKRYVKDTSQDYWNKNCLALGDLKLKVGALVIMLKNSSPEVRSTVEKTRLVNGDTGIIVDFVKVTIDYQIIEHVPSSVRADGLMNQGDIIELPLVRWSRTNETKVVWFNDFSQGEDYRRWQLPIKAAWAVTIHKAQGMTLDKAIVDVSDTFATGQTYVALSRVRTIEGLRIDGFDRSRAKANEAALKFYGLTGNYDGDQQEGPMEDGNNAKPTKPNTPSNNNGGVKTSNNKEVVEMSTQPQPKEQVMKTSDMPLLDGKFVIAGTGSRSLILDEGKMNKVKEYLINLLTQAKAKYGNNLVVISGMAEGFDEALARAAMSVGVTLIAAIPNKGYSAHYWGKNSQLKVDRMNAFQELAGYAHRSGGVYYVCGTSIYVDGKHSNFVRNEWMGDRADIVWVYNPTSRGTAQMYNYCRTNGIKTFIINIDEGGDNNMENPVKPNDSTPAPAQALVKLGKLNQETTNHIVSLLEKNALPYLQEDVSNYAKGRMRVWMPYEAPLSTDLKFKPGLLNGELWQFIVDLCAKHGFTAQLALASKGGSIKPHRDATYAANWSFGINLGECDWQIASIRDSAKLDYSMHLTGGEVFKFNSKHTHAVVNAKPDRWAINVWAIADGQAAQTANIQQRLQTMLDENPEVAKFIEDHKPTTQKETIMKQEPMFKQEEYKFLSNMYSCNIDGYTCVESFYQAMKSTDPSVRVEFKKLDGRNAKQQGKTLIIRPDWEEVKLTVMRYALEKKFVAGSDLANKLLATGYTQLIETNNWHDNFWGDCYCNTCKVTSGSNHLGVMLMEIRDNLKKDDGKNTTPQPSSPNNNISTEKEITTMNTTADNKQVHGMRSDETRIVTNYGFSTEDYTYQVDQFPDGPYTFAFLNHFFSNTMYRLEVCKHFKSRKADASNSRDKVTDDIVITWSNASHRYNLSMATNFGWLDQLKKIGLVIGNSKKMAKRLQEIVRQTGAYGYFDNIKIDTMDPVDLGVDEKYVDGISAISRSFAASLYRNNTNAGLSWVEKQIAGIVKGSTTIVSIRVITPNGLIKGNAIVLPDKMMNGYDIRTFSPNVKSELATTGWFWATIEPSYGRMPMKSDDLTLAIYHRIKGIIDPTLMIDTLKAVTRESIDNTMNGNPNEWINDVRKWNSVNEDDANVKGTIAKLNDLTGKLEDVGLSIESSQLLMYLKAREFGMHYGIINKNGPVADGYAYADNNGTWMPVPYAYRAHIMTREALEIFGFTFKNKGYEGFYHKESHCFVVPGEFFVANYINHGGYDLDDTINIMIRQITTCDGTNTLCAIIMRNPNDFAEWSEIPVSPKEVQYCYHKINDIPVVSWEELTTNVPKLTTLLSEGAIKYQYDELPGASSIVLDRQYSVTDAERNKVAAISLPGGTGATVLPKIIYYAVVGSYLEDQLVSNEQLIDAVQQGMATPEDMRMIRNASEEIYSKVKDYLENNAPYAKIDAYWANTRIPAPVNKRHQFMFPYEPGYAEENGKSLLLGYLFKEREQIVRSCYSELVEWANNPHAPAKLMTIVDPLQVSAATEYNAMMSRYYKITGDGSVYDWAQVFVDMLKESDRTKGEEYTDSKILRLWLHSFALKRVKPKANHDKWLFVVNPNLDVLPIDWLVRAYERLG